MPMVLGVVFWYTYLNQETVPPTVSKTVSGEALCFQGACDASAGVALTSDTFVMADDENNVLRLYNKARPSLPISETDLTSFLQTDTDHPEADIEAATRVDQVIYWITSHGRNKDGKPRPSRYRFFATAIRTLGQEVRLEPIGTPCKVLAEELSNVVIPPQLNLNTVMRLKDRLKKKEREGLAPKKGGLNIEGLSASADGRILYIGLRNPLAQDKAIIIPMHNAREVIEASARPLLGEPILWDLGRRGIRSMEYSPYHKAFLIVAGPINDEINFAFYTWTGQAKDQPSFTRSLNVGLPDFTPEAIIPFADEANVLLLSDGGTIKVQITGPHECTDENEYDKEKCTCPQKFLVEQKNKSFRGIFLHL